MRQSGDSDASHERSAQPASFLMGASGTARMASSGVGPTYGGSSSVTRARIMQRLGRTRLGQASRSVGSRPADRHQASRSDSVGTNQLLASWPSSSASS